MIHCNRNGYDPIIDAPWVAHIDFGIIYFDPCPLRAIWLALLAEVRTK